MAIKRVFGKPSNPKTTQNPLSFEDLNAKIKEVAQSLYEKRGRVTGHELDDWLEAERLVKKGRG